MKLELTKERILEAASKCSTAKETLKTLFPEAFEDDKYFDFSGMTLHQSSPPMGFQSIEIREGGKYEKKGFYLSGLHNWQIMNDEYDHLVLIPTKK